MWPILHNVLENVTRWPWENRWKGASEQGVVNVVPGVCADAELVWECWHLNRQLCVYLLDSLRLKKIRENVMFNNNKKKVCAMKHFALAYAWHYAPTLYRR